MTGTIKNLSTIGPSGSIRADSGTDVQFDSSTVRLRPGTAGLAAGQSVTFDLDRNKPRAAINVQLARSQTAPRRQPETEARTYLQYTGFGQTGTIRTYRFKRISHGEGTREFEVSADLALFAKYHIGIQEGPALSLRLVCAGPSSALPASWPSSQCLSEPDLIAHVATRALAAAKHRKGL